MLRDFLFYVFGQFLCPGSGSKLLIRIQEVERMRIQGNRIRMDSRTDGSLASTDERFSWCPSAPSYQAGSFPKEIEDIGTTHII